MKINKLTASCGKLENETLSVHDGLNIVNAPNESGKSTWCAFTRAMLYGVDSSERQRSGYMPDKLRYAPWSGAPMEGVMELTADNCDITITRRTKSKSAPMREFTATYTGTNVKVDGMTGTNAGEMLTGVSRDMFCRSAFIAQGAVAVSGSPELDKRISAIVSSGDEDTSYTEADARLRAWQRKRRANRKGLLPELETKIYNAEQMLSDMNNAAGEIEELEAQLAESRERCDELEKAMISNRKSQRKQSLEKLRTARANTERCSDAHDRSMAQLAEIKENASRLAPAGKSLSELEDEINSDISLYERSRARADGKRAVSFIPTAVVFILAIILASLFAAKQIIILAVCAGVMALMGVFLLSRFLAAKKVIQDEGEKQRRILKKYRAATVEEINRFIDEIRSAYDEIEKAKVNERRTRTDYENARIIQEQLEAEALQELDFSSGSSDAAKYGNALAAERRNAEKLSSRIASMRGRLGAIGDPMVISSELTRMYDERSELEEEYSAISLAIDTLREADAEIQSRFSPALGKTAAEYMNFLTGGRYDEVFLNRDFTAQAKADGDIMARDSGYLSAGTLDLMYLSIRLAVCELAMSKEEPCPLIIDDALVNLDDERFDRAIELLKRISRERQVILFNCRRSKMDP